MSIEPLPGDLKQLIDAEPPVALPADVETRLLSRLDASLAAEFAVPGSGAPSSPGASSLVKGVALFVAGAITGAVGFSQLAPRPVVPAQVVTSPVVVAPPVVSSPQVVPTPPAAPTIQPPPSLPAPRVPEPRPVRVVEPVTPVASPAPETTLERERQLLEPARTAIARSMSSSALPLLEQHAREYPTGLLKEERDALWVQALAVSRDFDSARAHAEQFRREYPDSLFLPIIERAVRDAGP